MSAPMKMRPIKAEIEIQVGGENARLFLVSKNRAEDIIRALKRFEVTESIPQEAATSTPWREIKELKVLIDKYTETGVALKGARAKCGLSQSALAAKLKIPKSHIIDMEYGRKPIDIKMAKRLAVITKVSYTVFL